MLIGYCFERKNRSAVPPAGPGGGGVLELGLSSSAKTPPGGGGLGPWTSQDVQDTPLHWTLGSPNPRIHVLEGGVLQSDSSISEGRIAPVASQ